MAMVWVDGKKCSKSLETKDELTATKRAAQAARELHSQAGRLLTLLFNPSGMPTAQIR